MTVWSGTFLEKHKLLKPVQFQCEFRKHRSTTDHLVCFETYSSVKLLSNGNTLLLFSSTSKRPTIQHGTMESCGIYIVLVCRQTAYFH